MREVFLNHTENTITFTHRKNMNVCVGETDGSLEDFLQFVREDWISRNYSLEDLPRIEEEPTK